MAEHDSPAADEQSGVPEQHLRRNRSFTRRGGRMPARHVRAWEAYAPSYLLELERSSAGTAIADGQRLDVESIFGRRAPLVVEIGSGGGDCVVAAAAADPSRDFLALEVWKPGVAQTLSKAGQRGVTNLRIAQVDAAVALPILFAPGSLAEVWTFFPDPWPKNKHHKRRLVTPELADLVASLLAPGGAWRLATDWADYAWVMRDVVEGCDALENPHRGRLAWPGDEERDPQGARGGFAPRFDGRAETRFEAKGHRAERLVRDVEARRR